MSAPIRVMIVDDHPVVRNGLSGMFAGEVEFEVIGEAADGSEALRRAQALGPDVILMDLRMPGMDGVHAIAALTAAGVPARVLVLTTYDTDSEVLAAIEAGATGYLLKDTPPEALLAAIREVFAGGAPMSPAIARKVIRSFQQKPHGAAATAALSARETEVLTLLAAGHSYKTAAARLALSLDTVRFHVRNIYDKLHVHSKSEAVARALRGRLLR